MRNLKRKILSIMICICTIFTIGCGKEETQLEDTSVKNNILELVQDKYFINLPSRAENGGIICGMICYFKDDTIQMSYVPGRTNEDEKFTHIDTEVGDNFIKYNIEENFLNNAKGYFKITKGENGELTFKCTWQSEGELKLLDREECIKVINDNFQEMRMQDFTQSFYKEFNLNIEDLKGSSNEENKESVEKEKIGAQKAQSVVRQLLNDDCWATNGTTFVNSKEYYAVEDTEIGMDFRYLVDVYDEKKVFVQSADNMNKLIPFEESRSSMNAQVESFSKEDALNQAIGRFGAVGYGEVEAGHELTTTGYKVVSDLKVENGVKYYSIEVSQVVKTHPPYEESGEWECDIPEGERTFIVNSYEDGSCY